MAVGGCPTWVWWNDPLVATSGEPFNAVCELNRLVTVFGDRDGGCQDLLLCYEEKSLRKNLTLMAFQVL